MQGQLLALNIFALLTHNQSAFIESDCEPLTCACSSRYICSRMKSMPINSNNKKIRQQTYYV